MRNERLRILLVDDQVHNLVTHQSRITRVLEDLCHFDRTFAETPDEALRFVLAAKENGRPFDLCFLDLKYGNLEAPVISNGLELAGEIKALDEQTLITVISSFGTDTDFNQASKSTAVDYFIRRASFTDQELYAMAVQALTRKLDRACALVPEKLHMYTNSRVMRDFIHSLDRVQVGRNVVIYGETGTGKELSALRLNATAKIALRQSARPLYAANCGSLTETLIEATVCGFKKGAFTGAVQDTPGWLDRANGGDLFLDEFQNAPRKLQELLLRIVQEKAYTAMGSPNVKKLDVRFIVALNKDPALERERGNLMPDLLSRLQQAHVTIPPLRERPDDVPLLVNVFLKRNAPKDKEFSSDAIELLKTLPWTENVRGVLNVVNGAIDESKVPVITRETIESLAYFKSMIAPDLRKGAESEQTSCSPSDLINGLAAFALGGTGRYEETQNQVKRKVVIGALNQARTVSAAAKLMGVPRSTLVRWLEELGLDQQPSASA